MPLGARAEFPETVTATGGRYQFKDDWQFYDTLVTNFGYPDKTLTWEGRCCQGMKLYGRDRGSVIMGTKGTVVIDRDGYDVYDWKGKQIDKFRTGKTTSSADTLGIDTMTDAHFANFISAIKGEDKLNSPIQIANVTVTMLLLSNIAYFMDRTLNLDTTKRPHQKRPRSHEAMGPRHTKKAGKSPSSPLQQQKPAEAASASLWGAGDFTTVSPRENLDAPSHWRFLRNGWDSPDLRSNHRKSGNTLITTASGAAHVHASSSSLPPKREPSRWAEI